MLIEIIYIVIPTAYPKMRNIYRIANTLETARIWRTMLSMVFSVFINDCIIGIFEWLF